MAYTIAFFGTKPYDEASFNEKNKEFGFELRFFKGHLNRHNVLSDTGSGCPSASLSTIPQMPK